MFTNDGILPRTGLGSDREEAAFGMWGDLIIGS